MRYHYLYVESYEQQDIPGKCSLYRDRVTQLLVLLSILAMSVQFESGGRDGALDCILANDPEGFANKLIESRELGVIWGEVIVADGPGRLLAVVRRTGGPPVLEGVVRGRAAARALIGAARARTDASVDACWVVKHCRKIAPKGLRESP